MRRRQEESLDAAATRVSRLVSAHPGGWVPDPPGSGVDPPSTADAADQDARSADQDAQSADEDADHVEESVAVSGTASRHPGAGELLRAAVAERLPPTLRGARVSPAGHGWRALAVVAVLAAVVSVGLWWRARSVPVVVPTPVASSTVSPAPTGTSGAAASPGVIVVDVSGKVRDPGVVRLPPGSRVQDAIDAAGGLKHGAKAGNLNLARELADGEQIVVGKARAPSQPVTGAPSSTLAPVDLNTATVDQLETLPGIGPVLAQRILDYRTAHGPFRSTEQLLDVSGIGDKTFADLAPHVRV